MKELIQDIKVNKLFLGVEPSFLQDVLSNKNSFYQKHYNKGQTIVIGAEICYSIGFITKGTLSIRHISFEGDVTSIAILKKGDCFGEALLFGSSNFYPYSLVAHTDLTVVYINKNTITKLLKNEQFSINYLKNLSEKISIINDKLLILSQKTLRDKILLYLYKEFQQQKSNRFTMRMSISDLADFLSAARPSVSRELINMQKDNLIKKDKKEITILQNDIFNQF